MKRTMPDDTRRLVTQADFVEMTKLEPLDVFLLIEDQKLPIVKRSGAHLIDINEPRAKCWLPQNRAKMKDLF